MRMWTTKSAVSRLERGRYARPTVDTVEKYALAVGARVAIRVHPRPASAGGGHNNPRLRGLTDRPPARPSVPASSCLTLKGRKRVRGSRSS